MDRIFFGRFRSQPAPSLRFQSISKETKQNIFDHTSVFVLFSPVHTDSFAFENAFFFTDTLLPIVHTKKTLPEMTLYDAFFVTVFKSLRFPQFTLETERFQSAPLSTLFSEASESLKQLPTMQNFAIITGEASNHLIDEVRYLWLGMTATLNWDQCSLSCNSPGERWPAEKSGGVCGPLPKTKICDFPYSIYGQRPYPLGPHIPL